MKRLKEFRRRFLIWFRGECLEEGCDQPPISHIFPRCEEHEAEAWRKSGEEFRAAQFEREVQIAAEALRRVAPELSGCRFDKAEEQP